MTTPPEENAALVRRFLIDIVAGGDTDAIEALVAGDIADHNLVFGADPGPESKVTTPGWSALASADDDIEIEAVVASGEQVAVRGTAAGTHRESLLDLTPTGRTFEIAYVWFCRIEEGRLAEIWSLPDGLGLMQQLGAIPELPSNRSLTCQTDQSTS